MDPSLARIAWTLKYLGHENLKFLNEDLSVLPSMGFEFTRKPHKIPKTNFVPFVNSELRITSNDLLKNLDQFSILDAEPHKNIWAVIFQIPNLYLLLRGWA